MEDLRQASVLASPHILIAGTTGSGKSVALNTLLCSAMNSSWFYIFDLKRVELCDYKRTDSCIGYVSEPEDVVSALDKVINGMNNRYKTMKGKQSNEVDVYVVIDELADVLSIKGVLERLVKIGRLGRAANVHLLCCTQDPSRRTLSAQLMQNFTCCIALRCRSAIESRQIIGTPGAEDLPLYGQALVWDDLGIERVTIPLTENIEGICNSHKVSHFKEIACNVGRSLLKALFKGACYIGKFLLELNLYILSIPFRILFPGLFR